MLESWLEAALRNFAYRLKLTEADRKELDDIVARLMAGTQSQEDQSKDEKRLNNLLNSPYVRGPLLPGTNMEEIQKAARKGFYSDENENLPGVKIE